VKDLNFLLKNHRFTEVYVQKYRIPENLAKNFWLLQHIRCASITLRRQIIVRNLVNEDFLGKHC
jgi:hypothetical protein